MGKKKLHFFFALWSTDPDLTKLEEIVHKINVLNDCDERGIALIQIFNNCITKNEEQSQFRFQFVQLHRQQFPRR